MKQKLFSFFLAVLGLVVGTGVGLAQEAFADFAVQLTAAPFSDNTSTTSFNVKVDSSTGTASIVEAGEESTFSFTSARWNDSQHGWVNCVFTIPVNGPVKIGLGNCRFGAQTGTIVDSDNNSTTLTVGNSNCWSSNDIANTTSYTVYKGTSATTLTVTCNGYCPYISVEAVDASELVSDATVSFSAGEATGMIVPASITGEVGSEITLPTNFTMYVEGKTLTGWSDGTTSYAPGASYTVPSADITLAPVFTENTVSLADRTEPVTLKWDFQRVNGAPTISSQNGTGLWVTQAIIGNETIDVKLDFDTNNGGKLANGNWTDWCQMNGGTTLTIPNYKGATVSMEAYNVITTTTIDGQSDYTQAKTISYTVANTAETIDIVIGDGTYYRYVQTVLPVVETRQASDLTLTSSNAVSLDANTTTSQITATTSATVGLTYTSSNPMVATVSNTGLITAVANGTATITVAQVGDATYMDDSKTVTVTVNNGVSASYSIAAQINNQSGTMLTSAETAAQGNAVSFGINAAGERVAADAADAVVTISGNYHSDHGVTNLVATVKATGNMMITIGNCTYNNGTITVSKGGQTVISESLSNTACWKNDHSDVTQVLYEGEAATLTVSVPNYCPYFAVESVAEVTKYTVTFMNGNETVDTKQVAEGTALGTLPTPTYDTDTQCFLGWYSDTDDLGTKAYTSTVPTGNTTLYAIIIDKPTEAAGYYVVNNGRELMAMIDYANANANANNPVKIFLKNGTYDLGSAAEITQLTGSYISLIGESLEGTIIRTTPVQEGLGTATLLYNKGKYNYLQDLTLHNNYPYGDSTGRAASLKDEGNYTICKNVWLYSHQDTYYSHTTDGYFYFNGGKISGCVDYMCGQSRVFFDGVTLSNDDKTSYMTANSELYVFNNCIVENNGSNTYYWGRSWSSVNGGPRCIFINTTLKDNGSHLGNTRWLAAGMNDPYVRAGEYGTKNAAGTDITPSSNIVNFTSKSGNVSFETILTADEAANYTLANIFGEWSATAVSDAAQATVSNVILNGTTLSWEGSSDAYLIEKGGEFVALTTGTSYTVDNALAAYTVRAANSRGGFGEAETSAVVVTFTISTGTEATNLVSMGTCNLSAIYSFMHILATKADGENTGKQDLSVKLQCKTAETEAAEVQFYVPEGFKFVPYSASVKVQPVGNDAYVKLELSDTGAGTTKISGSAESLPAGEITTVTLNMTEKYELESGVSLKLYCYDGGSTGVTQFRLGTPMTITGMLQPDVLTLTTTHNMEGYKAFYPGMANYIADENTDVYIAKSVGEDKVVLKRIENKFIPTQTAVILKTTGVADEPTENAYYQMTLTRSTYIDNDVTDNLLYVTMGNGWEDFTNGVYRLGYKAGQGVGFYTWKDPSPDEGIIYINKPISGNAKLTFVFFDEEEEATGVNTVSEDGAAVTSEAYNAAGQRVNAAENGFIIVKGKKYVK
ncbi:MAG: Ig-like domain-containing protein [Prevotella sp.]|nr:Ig-like domain-containing protein [Prevotella sp.]